MTTQREAEFKRFQKYLVVKIEDIEKHLSDEQQLHLDAMLTKVRVGRLKEGKGDQSYVCVAADWPMYEQVWKMVEDYVNNVPEQLHVDVVLARNQELLAEKAALEAEVMRLRSVMADVIKAHGYAGGTPVEVMSTTFTPTALNELVEKVERRTIERCAVVCEMLRDLQIYADKQEAQNDCAAAIRAME